jgi:hypothetical protein
MDKAIQPTLPVADAREDEKEAKATNDLSIPETSDVEIRVKAEKERDTWVEWARAEPVLGDAKYYVRRAEIAARKYGIPMPDLSSVMREKAENMIDSWMMKARNGDSISWSKMMAGVAQITARQYGLSTPELSVEDMERIIQRERRETGSAS